jgi:small nuclear ribonucleoprotein (snRNP)-like protein
MSSIQTELLRFFISFISKSATDVETSNLLIRKMLRNRKVQEIIVDCLFKLEPILGYELAALRSPEFKKNLALKKKESQLHVLAKDIKELMTNFESIKINLGSLSEKVEDFSIHLDQKPIINKESLQPSETPLVQFLSSLSTAELINNDEFEDFPREAWNKHTEVEKMLEAELYLYRIRWNSMENNNFCKISHIKQKSGLKIERLEKDHNLKYFQLIHELAQVGMELEERLGLENRRAEFEKKILKEEENNVFVPDLLSAVEKIRSLITVRQVLEFNRHEDDKIIQVLNEKIQNFAIDYTETQESLKNHAKFMQIMANSLVFILQNHYWNKDEQDLIVQDIKRMNFDGLEEKVQNLIMSRHALENKEKILIESPKREKNQIKRKSPRTKLKIITSLLHSPGREMEGSLNSVKKIMNAIDTEIKNRNKKLNENLSDIVANLHHSQKPKLKEISIKTKITEPRPEPKKITKEESIQTITSFKLFQKKDISIQTLIKSFFSQETETELSSLDIEVLENFKNNKDVVKEFQNFMSDKMISQETQTEKRVTHQEFSDSRALARNMMRKYTVPATTRPSLISSRQTPNDASSVSSNVFKSIETGVPITPHETVEEEEIKEAAEEYSKEFGIFTQFLGYKKLDFNSIQKLWEEVINRRLSEGEKDKITSYLKDYEGSSNYEIEKLKIIHMLMMIKKQKIDDSAFDKLVGGFKKKMNILNRWRKFLITFIQKNVKKILSENKTVGKPLDLFSMCIFLKIIRKNMTVLLEKKHMMKKSGTSVLFKDEDWNKVSKSPTLVRKIVVKSRLFSTKHNKTYEKILRIKSPAELRSFREIGKLPIIPNFLINSSK